MASIRFYKLRIEVSRLFHPSLSCMVLPEVLSGAIKGLTLTTLPEARTVYWDNDCCYEVSAPEASPLVSLSKVD